MGMKHKSVREALDYVARHPAPELAPVEMPVWELICRQLFETAHQVGGSAVQMRRTSTAHKIIFDRLAGKRKPGTHPAQAKQKRELKMVDLTKFGAGDD
jgi:hypothetical protein